MGVHTLQPDLQIPQDNEINKGVEKSEMTLKQIKRLPAGALLMDKSGDIMLIVEPAREREIVMHYNGGKIWGFEGTRDVDGQRTYGHKPSR